MEDSEENMSAEDISKIDSSYATKKSKKRSLIERELEINMNSQVTSPAVVADALSTSRYGRARRLKTDVELIESQKVLLALVKSPEHENTPIKTSPVYRMHASNSPIKTETLVKTEENNLDNQIDSIYQENMSISRFSDEANSPSPAKKNPKVYVRKDLIQNREAEETILMIRNLFSPIKGASRSSSRPLRNSLENSSEKYIPNQNGLTDNASVVKTLDFDGNKKRKKENKEQKVLSKNEMFEIEAKCPYQVGDLAWARMGTFPFWPCIITREPYSDLFVKRKLFGRVEHDILHVTFFGDNGRRSWIMDNMLRKYLGLLEFETTREKFTIENKKKDPKLYAAFFISEKKQSLWNNSVEEAEALLREPKRLRVDIFNDMLWKLKASKKNPKSSKITRTNSDVSLSESLYDSLFSEEDIKSDDTERTKNRSRNKSFDVSEVVTACLDNMAAKTGMTKIQRQSHMDRWLQKAKSKTPEKSCSKSLDKVRVKLADVTHNKDIEKMQTNLENEQVKQSSKSYECTDQTPNHLEQNQVKETNPTNIKQLEISLENQSSTVSKVTDLEESEEINKIQTNELVKVQSSLSVTTRMKHKVQEKTSQEMKIKQSEQPKATEKQLSNEIVATSKMDTSEIPQVVPSKNRLKLNRKGEIANIVSKKPSTSGDSAPYKFRKRHKKSCNEYDSPSVKGLNNVTENFYSKSCADNIVKNEKSVSNTKLDRMTCFLENNNEKLNNTEEMNYDTEKVVAVSDMQFSSESVEIMSHSNIEVGKDQTKHENKINAHIIEKYEACSSINVDDKMKSLGTPIHTMNVDFSGTDQISNEIDEYMTDLDNANLSKATNLSSANNKDHNKEINSATISNDLVEIDEKNSKDLETIHESNSKNQNLDPCNIDEECNMEIDKTLKKSKANKEKMELPMSNVEAFTELESNYKNSNNDTEYSEMDVEKTAENISGLKHIVNKRSSTHESHEESADEIVNINLEGDVKEDKSSAKFKTVSNASSKNNKVELIDANCSTTNDNDLKKAQDVITFEVSVTEKKTEATNNNLAKNEQEEYSNKPNLLVHTNINIKNTSILDINKKCSDICKLSQEDLIKKSQFEHKKDTQVGSIMEKIHCISSCCLNDQDLTDATKTDHSKKIIEDVKNKSDKSNVCSEKENDEDISMEKKNIDLNESGKSESLLHEFIDPDCKDNTIVQSETNTSLNESIESNSILENSIGNNGVVSSPRQYVESPTFTQLLESEEFFRDVNEPLNKTMSCENKIENSSTDTASNDDAMNKSLTTDDKQKDVQAITVVKNDEDLYDEETSEDEPSPEYESLDEDIAEDFRKHMMSIESNITDKRNEELIVKICNEIAEKAKLSPIKSSVSIPVAKPGDNIDTMINNRNDPLLTNKCQTNITEEKKIIYLKAEPTILEITSENANICKEPNEQYSDKSDQIMEKSVNKKLHNFSNELEEKKNIESSDSKLNGNATVKEIFDKTKIIYRTRWSLNKTVKDLGNNESNMQLVKAEQSRTNCALEAKVVIVPLEQDKTNFPNISISDNDDDKSKNKLKSRLSLKKDNIKNKQSDSENVKDSVDKMILQEPNSTPSDSVINKEHIKEFSSKDNLKLNVVNSATETHEPVKVNGSYNHVDKKYTNTPTKLIDDTDFDIDTMSLNSEDSNNSLPSSIESVPKRNLRSRPEKTLENALKNPEFLKYLELRQDYLLDEQPELNDDELVSYIYKTWQYEEDLKSMKSDDTRRLNVVKNIKQETPSHSKSKKKQPKNNIENYFPDKYEKNRKTLMFDSEVRETLSDANETVIKEAGVYPKSPVNSSSNENNLNNNKEVSSEQTTDLVSPKSAITLENNIVDIMVKDENEDVDMISKKAEESVTPKRNLRSKAVTPRSLMKSTTKIEMKPMEENVKNEQTDTESIDSTDSEIPLTDLQSKTFKEEIINEYQQESSQQINLEASTATTTKTTSFQIKDEINVTDSNVPETEPLPKRKIKKTEKNSLNDPGFLKFVELRQDALIDENPHLTKDEIIHYLYKTWLYEESSKSDLKKNDDIEQASLVKGIDDSEVVPPKKVRRRPKVEKQPDYNSSPKNKPKRRTVQPYYNENYSDIEEEIELFEIFKSKKNPTSITPKVEVVKDKLKSPKDSTKTSSLKEVKSPKSITNSEEVIEIDSDKQKPLKTENIKIENDPNVDPTEHYFVEMTKPKPNIFKGLMREKVCGICELVGNLVKCKGCNETFHADCVQKESESLYKDSSLPSRGRKKKRGRKVKSLEGSDSFSDEKSQNVSTENMSIDETVALSICTVDADDFESQLSAKMKELIDTTDINYDSCSSDDGIDWKDTVAGKCEIIEIKSKLKMPVDDYSNFKCNSCHEHDTPVCFVCKSAVSKTNVKVRQKCNVGHCHKYYHMECLNHWPQAQFNSWEPAKTNKKNDFIEALTCPRHVCHTCVSDDPRGCKTRFSGDKLARCVRCPATYHSFNKCLPAGSQILTASHIICPRHLVKKPGKVPCHVNTGWCFICAQGGSLICCEYCPTSFHAECLNIKPPEGNYMCEDCETGRLPLYGEMVWVKLGHYRWWPAMILHPSDIPENIMAVEHSLGEFVVRFFGQYDHYWVNRGRVFPYQEGDSGRVSNQKTKINAAFTMAIEHAQRACEIFKNAVPNDEESIDIASSLLPPHYVKLKSNKPFGSLCGRKIEDPSLSLTQCDCNPNEPEPCGMYSQCLNRMLLTECGPTCLAGERCNNRAFEKRRYPKLVPYRTPHRGWGLKTLEHIKAGQFVIEYVGELIDEQEFLRRMQRKHEIRDENFYFLTLDKERMIDAGPKGNLARFMNHCCDPNCETQKWTVLGDVRVGLFAIDDIPANSEVTFNYNLQSAGIEKKRCLCGAKRCSGYIGAKLKQDESQSKKGKNGKLVTKRIYRKKKPEDSPSTPKTPKQKKQLGRPPKPKELTEIEKDLLIIKGASTGESSVSHSTEEKQGSIQSVEDNKSRRPSVEDNKKSRRQSIEEKTPKSLKRKRISNDPCSGCVPNGKKVKLEGDISEVGD